MRADDFLALSKKSAQDKAEQLNLMFHLIRIDDKYFFDYPADERTDRVCVEIEKGAVVKAVLQ